MFTDPHLREVFRFWQFIAVRFAMAIPFNRGWGWKSCEGRPRRSFMYGRLRECVTLRLRSWGGCLRAMLLNRVRITWAVHRSDICQESQTTCRSHLVTRTIESSLRHHKDFSSFGPSLLPAVTNIGRQRDGWNTVKV